VMGCKAENFARMSDAARSPHIEALQQFIEVSDHIFQIKLVPTPSQQEWTEETEPQIMHVRPTVDEDRMVLKAPRPEEPQ